MYNYHISNGSGFGSIQVTDDLLRYSMDKTFETRLTYIQSLEKVEDKALNKCSAKLTYYNLLGDLQSVEFTINNNDFQGLKKAIGK